MQNTIAVLSYVCLIMNCVCCCLFASDLMNFFWKSKYFQLQNSVSANILLFFSTHQPRWSWNTPAHITYPLTCPIKFSFNVDKTVEAQMEIFETKIFREKRHKVIPCQKQGLRTFFHNNFFVISLLFQCFNY